MKESNFQALRQEITRVDLLLKNLGVPEAIFEREVKCFGNGGHIILPKEHLNKKVKVIIS